MKSALSDLYQEELLVYASAVEKFSRLQKPTGTGTAVSRSCGSRVTVDLMLLEDVISDIGLDVFIDNTGKPEIIELGYKLISNNGRVILVGVPKTGQNINIFSLPLHFGKTIVGSHGGEVNPSKDISRYLKLHTNNIINFNSLITSKFSLIRINEAITAMKNGISAGRILIEL